MCENHLQEERFGTTQSRRVGQNRSDKVVVGVVLVGRVPVGVFLSVEGSEEHGYGKYIIGIYYHNI